MLCKITKRARSFTVTGYPRTHYDALYAAKNKRLYSKLGGKCGEFDDVESLSVNVPGADSIDQGCGGGCRALH
jgi:hypothetical protein